MLTEAEAAAIEVVVARDTVWPDRAAAEESCGAGVLAGLAAAGWLDVWNDPDLEGVRVVLSPWAAAWLGVEPCEVTEFAAPRWVRYRMGSEGSVWGEWGRCGDGWPIRSPRYEREVDLRLARSVVAGKPDPNRDYFLEQTVTVDGDEVTRPVELFGLRVPIDPRLRGKGRKAG